MLRQLIRQWERLALTYDETLGNTQANVEAKVVVNTLADKLAEDAILTLSEKLAEKMALTLVTTLAYKLVDVERHSPRPSYKHRRCLTN